ncbi:MAG: ABC transporter permease [Lachnospiraceae bacterium]|nr:ABC transporter permease [Lachnospiraceae bacterium]
MSRLVVKNLKLNKKRSIVTVVGILLSTALLVAMTTFVSSFRSSLVEYEKANEGNYHFQLRNLAEEDLDTIAENRKIESYYRVKELGYSFLPESKNEGKPYLRFVAMDADGLSNAGIQLLEGRLPETANEIVIPHHLKTNARVVYQIGDKITAQLCERMDLEEQSLLQYSDICYLDEMEALVPVNAQPVEYTVVGIMERLPFSVEPYSCPGYTVVTYNEEITGTATTYARLTGKGLRDAEKVVAGIMGLDPVLAEAIANGKNISEEVADQYIAQFNAYPYPVEVNQWLIEYERIWPISDTYVVLFIMAVVVALVIVGTSVYCIKNSFSISIAEKTRQYGMLSSVGATKKQLRSMVHREAFVLGAIGIPLGVALGILASYILIIVSNVFLGKAGVISVYLIFKPAVIAIVIAVILAAITVYESAFMSAFRAGKITPLEAIRNQNEIKLRREKMKTPRIIEKIWGIGGVITYKNIKRNRRRYRTTTISIVLCTVTFIVVSYFFSLTFHYVEMERGEETSTLYAFFEAPASAQQLESELAALDHVDAYNLFIENEIMINNPTFTKEYLNFNDTVYGGGEPSEWVRLLFMNDSSFAVYAKENGIAPASGGIFVNKIEYHHIDENNNYISGELRPFQLNKGEEISLALIDYRQEEPENYTVEIAGFTEKRPFGTMKQTYVSMLILPISMGKNMGIIADDEDLQWQISFLTEQSDQVQDELDDIWARHPEFNLVTVSNIHDAIKETRSLYTLIGIFAYGLITVIACIGITNIINTIGTGMELRSRDFAMLKSIGMTSKQFHQMTALETLFLGGKSLLIGNGIGFLLSFLICKIESRFQFENIYHPPVKAGIISVVVVFAVIYVIIALAMKRINKRNIIDTIKNENL